MRIHPELFNSDCSGSLSYFITTLTNGMFLAPRGCLLSPPRPILDQGVGQTHLENQAGSREIGWLKVGRYDTLYLALSCLNLFVIPEQLDRMLTFHI